MRVGSVFTTALRVQICGDMDQGTTWKNQLNILQMRRPEILI